MQKEQIDKLLSCLQIQRLKENFAEEIINFRIVGGAIRNIILDRKVKDIDFATSYDPQTLINLCKEKNIRYIPTGLKYGTITIILGKFSYEITSLREDVETNGRHAVVTYGHSWKKDSLRRDFTINALYLDFSGNLYDYHNGLKDLKEKKLKFIGDSKARIEEDFLRILRLFRFFSELDDFTFADNLLEICKELRDGMINLSAPRIKNEFFRMLQGNNYDKTLELLSKYKICNNFIKINQETVGLFAQYKKINQNPPNNIITIAYIIIAGVKPKKSFFQVKYRLGLSKPEKKQVKLLIDNKLINLVSNKTEIQKLLVKYGRENIKLLYEYYILENIKNYDDYQDLFLTIHTLDIPEFPVVGEDLKILGLAEGEELGNMLKLLQQKWLDSDFVLTKEELLELAKID